MWSYRLESTCNLIQVITEVTKLVTRKLDSSRTCTYNYATSSVSGVCSSFTESKISFSQSDRIIFDIYYENTTINNSLYNLSINLSVLPSENKVLYSYNTSGDTKQCEYVTDHLSCYFYYGILTIHSKIYIK